MKMDSEIDPFIEGMVDGMNEIADDLMEEHGAKGAATALVKASHVLHYHEPWDTAFMVLIEGDPAPIISEAFDAWFATDDGARRLDLDKGGGEVDPPVAAHYRPKGGEGPSLELEWHPVEGADRVWRAVSVDGEALPRIELAMLSFSERHPLTKEELAEKMEDDT